MVATPGQGLVEAGSGLATVSDATENNTIATQNAFLEAFAKLGTIHSAAAVAEVHRMTVWRWDNGDVLGFSDRYVQAQHDFREYLQEIARQRVEDPTGNRGSDVLLLGLLNAHWPEKYRPNQSGADDTAKNVLVAFAGLGRHAKVTYTKETLEAETEES